MTTAPLTGRCECGAIRLTIAQARPTATVCHCSQCRRISGHIWASTTVEDADLTIAGEDHLRWYASSDHAKRGFCDTCGSALFYRPDDATHTGVAMGCLDQPTGITPGKHIFTADRGDYYALPDDAPHFPD